MLKCIFGLTLALFASLPLRAQQDEEVLFTVAGEPVTVGEFRYIYTKTNAGEATFSRESVMEYLDLYERFKLKVARARDMGLDTVAALQNELEGYRKQLADNYLVDREVTDALVRELHARQATDVDFSHILFKLPSDDPADTLRIYEQAMGVRKQLTPENFAERATVSEDAYSKDRGGRIGYVSAPLPRGLHRLEQALWSTPDGQVGGPVRTAAGYHLYLKHGSRPAYGEIEIAHILLRKPTEAGGDAGAENIRERADRARQILADGESFATVAAEYSEDDDTKNQGGYIGFFGINRYNKDFERAAFALAEDGEISDVIESPVGFHILRRISRRGVQPLEEQRPLLEAAVEQDNRYAEARQAMIERLKQRYGTQVMEDDFANFAASLDSSFFEMGASFAGAQAEQPLLRIGDRTLTVMDFDTYLSRNARLRASLQRRLDPVGAARELYQRWTSEQVEAYAEAQLEDQFPEFKALMREYREGILLFEATKMEVWDKAGEDSLGLDAYFTQHRSDYTFGPRAEVERYTIAGGSDIGPEAVLATAAGSDAESTLETYGRAALSVESELMEADRLPAGLTLLSGSKVVLPAETGSGQRTVYYVRGVEAARPKELNEARGYVIADYQDQLERQWVEELRQEYDVKVNRKVLNKLVQH